MLKLRHILTGFFCLAALIPLALFWLWPTSYALDSEIKDVRERHLVIAQSLARVLEQYHKDLVTLFDVIAVNVDTPGVEYSFGPIFDSLAVRHVCIADLKTGVVQQSLQTGNKPCPAKVPAERWALFQDIASESETRFTGVLPTPEGSNVIIALKIVGDRMIIGAVYTKYIVELGRGIKFGHRGHAAIVDQNGRALSHPNNDWQSSRFDMSGISAVQDMLSGSEGVASFYSPALDAEMIAGYTAVEGPNWGVMVPQPISELENKAQSINFAAMIILLVGLGMAMFLAVLASGFLTRRIDEFIALMTQVGNGTKITKRSVPTGILTPWEFRLAYFQLLEMARKLSSSVEVILHQANYDSLTNLPNRRSFFADLEARFESWPEDGSQLTIGVLDLDRFKLINDLYGHVVGDKLLSLVSRRIKNRFSGKLTLYRLGGDEFGIILSEDGAPHDLESLGAQIRNTFDRPIRVDEITLTVSGSIGFACHTGTANTPLKLFEQADYALYQAKFDGRNSFTIFSDSHLADMTSSVQMLHHMHNANFFDQLYLEYQPIANIQTGCVARVEALARWNNPHLGDVSPSSFISAAERNGMMDKVTLHLFAEAVNAMKSWPKDLSLSFNLSANDIASISTRLGLRQIIRNSGLRPSRFTFELTETSVIRDMQQARETVDFLRDCGAQVALDDFGTGQTSLSQLHRLPIDSIKIDRSFITDMSSSPVHMNIVSSLVQMANKLELECTAEGVETDRQLEELWGMQCQYAQGFRISGPVPAHEVPPLLHKPMFRRRVRGVVA